jgi:polyisoprenoid-binding protein YceI
MNSRLARPSCAFLALAGASVATAATIAAAADVDVDVDNDHRTIYFAVAHRDISYVRGRFALGVGPRLAARAFPLLPSSRR